MLFFRFDFCVPTSDKKTPTENLGQVIKKILTLNLYDFDQVDLSQPKGSIGTLSRIHEFFLQCYTWHKFSGFSLRILVAGVRWNVTGEYFEKGSTSKKKNTHRLANIVWRFLFSKRRILQSLMPNKHPAFSLVCLHQCHHMMDAKEEFGVQKTNVHLHRYM